jgi:hypothetical protein
MTAIGICANWPLLYSVGDNRGHVSLSFGLKNGLQRQRLRLNVAP